MKVAVEGTPIDEPRRGGAKTKKYRFIGSKHTHNGEALTNGDVVDLTDAQYQAFADKFEPEGGVDREVDAPDAEVGTAGSTVPNPGTPQDESAKNPDADFPRGAGAGNTPGPTAASGSVATEKDAKDAKGGTKGKKTGGAVGRGKKKGGK